MVGKGWKVEETEDKAKPGTIVEPPVCLADSVWSPPRRCWAQKTFAAHKEARRRLALDACFLAGPGLSCPALPWSTMAPVHINKELYGKWPLTTNQKTEKVEKLFEKKK